MKIRSHISRLLHSLADKVDPPRFDLIVAAAKERRDLAWGKVIDNPKDEL